MAIMIYIQKIEEEFEFVCDDRRDLGLLQRCKVRKSGRYNRNHRGTGDYREWNVPADPDVVRILFATDARRQAYWHDSMAPYLPPDIMPDMRRVPETRYWHYEPRLGRDEGKEPRS